MLNRNLPLLLFIEEKKLMNIGQQEKAKLREEQLGPLSIWVVIGARNRYCIGSKVSFQYDPNDLFYNHVAYPTSPAHRSPQAFQ